MKKRLISMLRAIPGHSLAGLLVALGFLGAAEFVPNGLELALRVAGYLLLVLSAAAAVRDLPAISDWLACRPLAWYGALRATADRYHGRIRRCEAVLAVAVILTAAVHFGQSVRAMSSAPLRVDEIGAVMNYSSRGPILSATRYNLAKNHIFFSVANSLTPWSASLAPARARLWSFVAVGLSLVILCGYFWHLGSPIAGAVALALPALNFEHLQKVFEARGFGFLTLASVLGLIGLHGFLRSGRARSLWILGASTALGTWTLPFYVVFGGGLMLLLFLKRPSKPALVAGLATCFAILVLYAPVLVQMSRVAWGYEENYGSGFASIGNVLEAMQYTVSPALVRVDGALFLAAVLLVIVLPIVLRGHLPQNHAAMQIAAVQVLAFFLFCLALGSPPIRITAFLAMPVAFVAGMAAFQGLTFRALSPLRPPLAAGLAAVLLVSGISAVKAFAFEPDQRWQDAASAVRALFPEGVRVSTSGYRKMLTAYLDSGFDVQEGTPTEQELRGGAHLLFSAAHFVNHQPLDAAALYPGLELQAIRFPLRGSMEQILFLHVPAEFVIRSIRLGDRMSSLPAAIPGGSRVNVALPDAARSVHFLFREPVENLDVTADGDPAITKSGNLITLTLPKAARGANLRFPDHSAATIEAAWAYSRGF